jgi:hypothetical protein
MWIVLRQPQHRWMFTCKFRTVNWSAVETCCERQGCPSLLLWPRTGDADIMRRTMYGLDALACPSQLYTCQLIWTSASQTFRCTLAYNHYERKWKAIIQLCLSYNWMHAEGPQETSMCMCLDVLWRIRLDFQVFSSSLAIFTCMLFCGDLIM